MGPYQPYVDALLPLVRWVAYFGGPCVLLWAAWRSWKWWLEERVRRAEDAEQARQQAARARPPAPLHPGTQLVSEILWEQLQHRDLLQRPNPQHGLAIAVTSEERALWACGHYGPARYELLCFGEKLRLPEELFAGRQHCHDCYARGVARHSIRCARCGRIIGPGHPVAADYSPKPPLAEFGSITPDGDFIACCRHECSLVNGGGYVGVWNGRAVTPHEVLAALAPSAVAMTGEAVLVTKKGVRRLDH